MDILEGLWRNLKLDEEEETGIACSQETLSTRIILAAEFLTRRTVNIESVARTFKPLWRTQKEFRIQDMGNNRFFFEFDNEYDLERVLEHEPWTYDKHLVIMERVVDNIPISAIPFRFVSFWIQIHNLPVHCMTSEVRDSIGSSVGSLLNTTESEEDGNRGSYLRVRVRVDITKPLSRVRKIWLEGKVIGWAALKYERLPNFCYWCGLVSHDDRDCDRWLGSKGSLWKEDQQYGDWMRAKTEFSVRRSSIFVQGSSQSQAGPKTRTDAFHQTKRDGENKKGMKTRNGGAGKHSSDFDSDT